MTVLREKQHILSVTNSCYSSDILTEERGVWCSQSVQGFLGFMSLSVCYTYSKCIPLFVSKPVKAFLIHSVTSSFHWLTPSTLKVFLSTSGPKQCVVDCYKSTACFLHYISAISMYVISCILTVPFYFPGRGNRKWLTQQPMLQGEACRLLRKQE